MAVSKRVRFEVLRRDNYSCRYCGGTAPDVTLVVDHVVPVALGGPDTPSNLVAACRDCNSGKTSISPDSPIVADVNAKAERWAQAMQQAAAEREAEYAKDRQVADRFRGLWEQWTWTDHSGVSRFHDLPVGFDQSVRNFLAAGLNFADFDALIDVAMGTKADKWKYFCGCCWNRIRKAQERASAIVTAEEPEVDDVSDFWTEVTASETEHLRNMIAEQWLERFGTEMAMCLCSSEAGKPRPFCGDYVCMVHLSGMAQGLLLGFDTAAAQFITVSTAESAAPTPQVPAPPVQEPEVQYPDLYDPAPFRIAETLERELAELQAARRRARAASQEKRARDGS